MPKKIFAIPFIAGLIAGALFVSPLWADSDKPLHELNLVQEQPRPL